MPGKYVLEIGFEVPEPGDLAAPSDLKAVGDYVNEVVLEGLRVAYPFRFEGVEIIELT
jgi:hypothetical protein